VAKKKQTKDISIKKKILLLESVYGQKETARRLGVTQATLINYKNKNTIPPSKSKLEKKLNYVFGHSKKKTTFTDIKKTFRKENKRTERKQAKELTRVKNNDPVLVSPKQFVRIHGFDKRLREEFFHVADFEFDEKIATFPHIEYGQIVGTFDQMRKNYGKPPKVKKVEVIGVYTIYMNTDPDEEKNRLVIKKFNIGILEGYQKFIPLAEFLPMVENKFFSKTFTYKSGKRKDVPKQLLGYRLI